MNPDVILELRRALSMAQLAHQDAHDQYLAAQALLVRATDRIQQLNKAISALESLQRDPQHQPGK